MTKAAPEKTAVLVVDLQVGMLDGVKMPPLDGHRDLMARARAIIAWARARGSPVAFVRHDGEEGDALTPGSPGWPVHPDLAQAAGEPIFSKTVGDAFAPGELAPWLAERAVETVVLLGAQTDQCVNATFGGALAAGFGVIVASDAHGTWDYNGETAGEIIARHNARFAAAGASVVPTERLIAG